VFSADWNPKLAAQYLDSRQKEWFAWSQAASADGPCVSCHTGLPYLLARPALRRVLGETQPTLYETGLLNRLRAKAGAKPPGPLQGVETIFTALFLTRDGADPPALQKAFDQLWLLQVRDGRLKGAWPWYSANLDPWETPPSLYYGTALAALAIGAAPQNFREVPEAQERLRSMEDYLHSGLQDRPLHSRMALLWASSKLPEILTPSARQALIDELQKKQAPDGGWTLESLGPWTPHPDAALSTGSHSYATAFSAYVLGQAGVPSPRALEWLRSHQDLRTGAWSAASMNKHYPAGSMEEKFLQDAATAFAALALIEGGR
jgi:squalene-hopene/tetraprenyl-beta-curcumene cyclase